MSDELDRPIFVVGVPRSGTTLISTILSSSTDVCIAPEIWFYNYWVKKYRFLELSKQTDFDFFVQQFLNSKRFQYLELNREDVRERIHSQDEHSFKRIFSIVLSAYAENRNKKRVGEKTPGQFQNIDELLRTFPDSRILCMLRSPSAVAASTRESSFGSSLISKSASRWSAYSRLLHKYVDHERVKIIRYEDVILDFAKIAPNLSDFLQIDLSDDAASTDRSGSYAVGAGRNEWAANHFEKSMKPITSTSLNKWESQLSVVDRQIIRHFTADEANKWGYSDEFQSISNPSKPRLLADRLASKFTSLMTLADFLTRSPRVSALTYAIGGFACERN